MHNDGQNIVFLDGHAKWEQRQKVVNGYTWYGYAQ
jgi:prepilin-type processing-associated H-X9-DG protein